MRDFKQIKIDYDKLIEKIKVNPKAVVKESESEYRRKILSVANSVINDFTHSRIVLITGPSASGKTTTSNLLTNVLKAKGVPCVVISMDDFYISAKNRKMINGKIDYESINALDIDMFKECVNNLIKHDTSKMPRYDFANGEMRKDVYELTITRDTVIIIEGIHAFNPDIISDEMRDRVFRLYVYTNSYFLSEYKVITPAMLRFFRRLIRDYHKRGASVAKTKQMWQGVIEGEQKYITPYKKMADVCIDTTHLYEPFIYLDEMGKIAQNDAEAGAYLTIFESDIEFDRSLVGRNSLIWEFLS